MDFKFCCFLPVILDQLLSAIGHFETNYIYLLSRRCSINPLNDYGYHGLFRNGWETVCVIKF